MRFSPTLLARWDQAKVEYRLHDHMAAKILELPCSGASIL
jgi:hypothetical protein